MCVCIYSSSGVQVIQVQGFNAAANHVKISINNVLTCIQGGVEVLNHVFYYVGFCFGFVYYRTTERGFGNTLRITTTKN